VMRELDVSVVTLRGSAASDFRSPRVTALSFQLFSAMPATAT